MLFCASLWVLEQVQELAKRFGLKWETNTQSQQLMEMIGGYPYLINLTLHYLCIEEIILS